MSPAEHLQALRELDRLKAQGRVTIAKPLTPKQIEAAIKAGQIQRQEEERKARLQAKIAAL